MAIFDRISARLGQTIDLNMSFYHSGTLADPYAIRKIEIYRTQVLPHNLVATVIVADPTDIAYPLPVIQETTTIPAGDCGTGPQEGSLIDGKYHLYYDVPAAWSAPDVYFDLWYYYANYPCASNVAEIDCDLISTGNVAKLIKCCHQFWLYPDNWFCDDGLQTVNFGFEPMSQKFHTPEVRPLEVGLMPLPLYDYNYNLVNPLIPYLKATISFETQYSELLVDNAPMTMGVRQGSYRSNPWVLKYNLDTTVFRKGTYKYRILLTLPDGTTRASKYFVISVD